MINAVTIKPVFSQVIVGAKLGELKIGHMDWNRAEKLSKSWIQGLKREV